MLQALLLKYFDGKLFGSIYHKMKHGAKYGDQCFQKVRKYMILNLKRMRRWL
jgi:hypothetical protein